jgi:hypothetical protein
MHYQLLQELNTLHVADLQRAAAATHRHAPARLLPSLRVRAGWTLVAVGLSLAVRPAASPRPRTG